MWRGESESCGSDEDIILDDVVLFGLLQWLSGKETACNEGESESEVAQSCPTLGDPMDCSLSGSSVPGILQARTLKWVAISFSNA